MNETEQIQYVDLFRGKKIVNPNFPSTSSPLNGPGFDPSVLRNGKVGWNGSPAPWTCLSAMQWAMLTAPNGRWHNYGKEKNKFVLWCFMYPITIELLVKALYPTPPNPWLTLQPRNGPCPNSPPWPFSLGAGGCWNAMTMETDPWRQTAASHTSGPRLATKTYAFEVSISVPPMPPGNNW